MAIKPNLFLLGTAFSLGAIATILQLVPTSYAIKDYTSQEQPYLWNLSAVHTSDILFANSYAPADTTLALTAEEQTDLTTLRDQEKLAHDVFTTLYNTWGMTIFNNISNSEQTHTNTAQTVLTAYGIENPTTNGTVGQFDNPEIQTQYETLTTQGATTPKEALVVGASLQELTIQAVEGMKSRTTNPDILRVYENIQKGSRNHLRSYTTLLGRYGDTYTPQYLGAEEYQPIVSAGMELETIQ